MKAISLPFLAVILSVSSAHAASVAIGTAGADPNNFSTFTGGVLQSVTLGGTLYSTTSLVRPTITGFAGGTTSGLLINSGGGSAAVNGANSAATEALRRALIETDWDGNTGIINSANTGSVYALSFGAGLVNIAGPDLIFYEINPGTSADSFDLTINGMTITISGTSYGDTGADSNSDIITHSSTPSSLSSLLTGTANTVGSTAIVQNIFGIGIDFSDFGVAANGVITSITFDSNGANLVDPVIIAGVQGVPEPSAAILSLLGLAAALGFRRR